MDRINIPLSLLLGFALTITGCSKKESTEVPPKIEVNKQQAANAGSADIQPDLIKAARTNIDLGLGYLNQGQTARAKTKLTHAVKIAPKMAEAHTAMAHFWEMVGDYKDAEKSHKLAQKYAEKTGAVYNNYGAFLCRRGQLKEADTAFHKALSDKDYPRTAEIYENAGICALKWPDLAVAEDYFQKAIKRDPRRSSAMLELASLSLKNGKPREAKEFLAKFKQLSEPSAKSLALNIKAAQSLNDDDAAATNLLLLKNLFEKSAEYQEFLKSEFASELKDELPTGNVFQR